MHLQKESDVLMQTLRVGYEVLPWTNGDYGEEDKENEKQTFIDIAKDNIISSQIYITTTKKNKSKPIIKESVINKCI
jgi:hypothetical protein